VNSNPNTRKGERKEGGMFTSALTRNPNKMAALKQKGINLQG
jgi:hypothetical protein